MVLLYSLNLPTTRDVILSCPDHVQSGGQQQLGMSPLASSLQLLIVEMIGRSFAPTPGESTFFFF